MSIQSASETGTGLRSLTDILSEGRTLPDDGGAWSLEWVPSGTRAGAIAVTVFAP